MKKRFVCYMSHAMCLMSLIMCLAGCAQYGGGPGGDLEEVDLGEGVIIIEDTIPDLTGEDITKTIKEPETRERGTKEEKEVKAVEKEEPTEVAVIKEEKPHEKKEEAKEEKEEGEKKDAYLRMRFLSPEPGEIYAGGRKLVIDLDIETSYKQVDYSFILLWGSEQQPLEHVMEDGKFIASLPYVTSDDAKVRVVAKVDDKEIVSTDSPSFTLLSSVQRFGIRGPEIVNMVPFKVELIYPTPNYLARFRIYYSKKDSGQWSLYGEAPATKETVEISLPDGRYDFFFAGEDIVGNKIKPPVPGLKPHFTTIVDTTAPQLVFYSPEKDELVEAESFYSIRYEISDIKVDNVKFFYSANLGEKWEFIAESSGKVPNEIIWNVPEVISNKVIIKAICYDKAGNKSETVTDPFQVNFKMKIVDLVMHDKYFELPIKLKYRFRRRVKHDSLILFYSTDLQKWTTYKEFKSDAEIHFNPSSYGKFYLFLAPVRNETVVGPMPGDYRGEYESVEFLPKKQVKYTVAGDFGSVVRGGDKVNIRIDGDINMLDYVTIRLVGESTVFELGNYKPSSAYTVALPEKDIEDCLIELILKGKNTEKRLKTRKFKLDSTPPIVTGVSLVK